MHYTVRLRNAQHAVQETREWLGDTRFELLVEELRKFPAGRARRLRSLYFYLGIAGVQGRGVVHAMYRYIWN